MIKIENSNKSIGSDQPVFFIAEIGKNFIQTAEEKTVAEYLANAKALVKAAQESGADAVKFQTHNLADEFLNINVVSPHFKSSDRYNWIKRNQAATPLTFWQEIKKYANELGLIFFSTPMSRGAAQILSQVDVPLWKVGSADILDFVLLDYLAQTNKPIIISSGMSTLAEIDLAIDFLKKRINDIVLLHCVSQYPCPIEKLNLNTIKFFQERYGLPIGFSDHSIAGQQSVLAAVSLGATVIEKHFSLSRDFWGSDHQVSMLPAEFKAMVAAVKGGEPAQFVNLGQEAKFLDEGEAVFRPIFRKSLVAGADLKAGEILTKEKIFALRPQQFIAGLPSEEYEKVLNKKLIKDLKKYEPISWEMLVNENNN